MSAKRPTELFWAFTGMGVMFLLIAVGVGIGHILLATNSVHFG